MLNPAHIRHTPQQEDDMKRIMEIISGFRISQNALFVLNFTKQLLWHKFNCFSVTDARKINDVLLWSILPSAIICYAIMYFILPAEAIDEQWMTLFITKAAQLLFLSIISYHQFKGTRNAGMATAVMVYCGINFVSEILGFNHKMFWFNAMSMLFFAGLGYFILKDAYKRCKDGGEIL